VVATAADVPGAVLEGEADAAGFGKAVGSAAFPEQAASRPPIAISAAFPRNWRRVKEAGMATLLRRWPESDALS
jgi:hypothetical protein